MKETRSRPLKDSVLRMALIISVCAAVCFLSSRLTQAQEASSATGAGSSWQARAAKAATPAPRVAVSGSSSSWSAGAGSIPTKRQPGGVWQEGSTSNAAVIKRFAKITAPGANPLNNHAAQASLAASPGIGRVGAVPYKMQVSKSSNGLHALNRAGSSTGLHSGVGRSGPAGAHGSRARSAATGHRGQSDSQSRNGTKASSPSQSSSTESDSSMKALSNTPMPTDSLGSDQQSPPSEQPY